MESPNISLQVTELDPSCLKQTHSIRPGTGPGYENMEPGCILTVLCIPFIICPLSSPTRLFKRFCAAGTNELLDLVSLGKHLRTHLKDHTGYDQSPGIYGKTRRVSLLSI